jgi:SAM-dependent methyltransferase
MSGDQGYWGGIAATIRLRAPIGAWRAYMRVVYKRLIDKWLGRRDFGRALKTDLFEEAVSPHHVLSDLGAGSIGMDCSSAIVAAAQERLRHVDGRHLLIVGDVRRPPLKSMAVGCILSGSSLDHFSTKADIATSLTELARVLAPQGVLVITFDNPHNPVVWLRNRLPFAFLNRLGLVPYYVGATYNRVELRRQLEGLGLTVTHMTAVVHAPRAPAIWFVALVERLNWTALNAAITRGLDSFEVLERWPTRYLTGYYLAVRAEKCRYE